MVDANSIQLSQIERLIAHVEELEKARQWCSSHSGSYAGLLIKSSSGAKAVTYPRSTITHHQINKIPFKPRQP
jgi:hypothetical protein